MTYKNNKIKLSERILIQQLIEDAREVIKNATPTQRGKQVFITSYERDFLTRLIYQMCASLSNADNRVAPNTFIRDYMKDSITSIRPIAFSPSAKGDDGRRANLQAVYAIIDKCEDIANREIGNLNDLKQERKNEILDLFEIV